MIEPYYQDDYATIYNGDCLRILPEIRGATAVLTDPPYSSGGQFRGDRAGKTSVKYVQTESVLTCRAEFSGDNRDQRSFLKWASLWLGDCLHVCGDGAILMVFTDWRQLPTMTDAVQCGGWVWRNLVTWWKPGIRMQRGRFSSSAEYIVYASAGVPKEGELSPQNVLSCAPVPGSEKEHIAEKPLQLLKTLIGVTPADAVLLDPFMGSGSTLIAAKSLGRKAIGIEIQESYCKKAVELLSQEVLEL